MLDVILWLIVVEILGLVAFPLSYYLLPHLKDRGFGISKILGILLIGYLSWILSVFHILPSLQITIAALFLIASTLSIGYAWTIRKELTVFIARERTTIIISEALFFMVFAGWIFYRAYDPSINHTEQPMDFAFLNASIRSSVGIPEDPWLRGESINYYYFGYWAMGLLSKLTNVPSSISYNLSLALLPAIASSGIFCLVYNMSHPRSDKHGKALASGISAALLLILVSNLEGALEFMRANSIGVQELWDWIQIKLHPTDSTSPILSALDKSNLTQSWRPEEFWWWFRATRVIDTFDGLTWIDTTIQEFPFFSFMLGDLHPHVMSIPFVCLFLTFVFNLLKSPINRWKSLHIRTFLLIPIAALILGGLGFTNIWDLPTFSAILLVSTVLKAYSDGNNNAYGILKYSALTTAAILGLALLLYLPYYVSFFSGQVSGIGPVMMATTRPIHTLIVWGLFFVIVIPFILNMFWNTTFEKHCTIPSIFASSIGFFPYILWAFLFLENGGATVILFSRFFHILPFALLVSVSIYTALWMAKKSGCITGQIFALMLSGISLSLIMVTDLIYLDDSFGPPNERMNTVFKFYYQAWILLAVSSGFTIYYWTSIKASVSGLKRFATRLWAIVIVILLIACAYYPAAAPISKWNFSSDPTLDGLAYIKNVSQAEYDAIQFIKKQASPDSSILEAVGEWHDAGLVSRSTGVPTVLNWPGHQIQWRGSNSPLGDRAENVATIYQTLDTELAKSLLSKYRVDYVYVGPRERETYGTDGLKKFSSFMKTVFSKDGILVYRLPQ